MHWGSEIRKLHLSQSISLPGSFMLFKNSSLSRFLVPLPLLCIPWSVLGLVSVLRWFLLPSQSLGVVIHSMTLQMYSAVHIIFSSSPYIMFLHRKFSFILQKSGEKPLPLRCLCWLLSLPPKTELGAPYLVLPKYCNDLFPWLASTPRVRGTEWDKLPHDSPQESEPLPWSSQSMTSTARVSSVHGTAMGLSRCWATVCWMNK